MHRRLQTLLLAIASGCSGTLLGACALPSGTTAGAYAAIVTYEGCPGCRSAYTVSLVDAGGTVVARSHAVIGTRYVQNCSDCVWPLDLPPTSVSDDRVYFRDGDGDVRWLSPDGATGLAAHLPTDGATLSAFSVSADDRLIAISTVAQGSGIVGHERIVVERLADRASVAEPFDDDVCLPQGFGSSVPCTDPPVAVPLGWSHDSLILPDPAGYRLVGLATHGPGTPLACRPLRNYSGGTLDASSVPGPLCLDGSARSSGARLERWDGGATRIVLPALPCGEWSWPAVSPDARHVAALETAGSSGPGCGDPHIVIADSAGQLSATGADGVPVAWLDSAHLLIRPVGSPTRLEILEPAAGRVRSTTATGDVVGTLGRASADATGQWQVAKPTPSPAPTPEPGSDTVLCTLTAIDRAFSECPVTSSSGFAVTAGPDGALSYVGSGGDVAGSLQVAGSGQLSVRGFRVPGPPILAARGTDGTVWFTEPDSDRVGRISPRGRVTEFRLLPQGSPADTRAYRPSDTTPVRDGTVWVIEDGGLVARITAAGGITQFTVPGANLTTDPIGVDGEGTFWILHGDAVGRMTASGDYAEWPLPGPAEPDSLALGAGGSVWVARWPGDVVRMTSQGTMTVLPLPRQNVEVTGLTSGRDGTMWFNEYSEGAGAHASWWIARISPDGHVDEYSMPSVEGRPRRLAVAADGALWVTGPRWIGRFVPAAAGPGVR